MIPTGGCALAALGSGQDPVGSATPFDQLFLLQLPPPWERIAADTPGIPDGMRDAMVALARAGIRAYALLIDDGSPAQPDQMRLIHYYRTSTTPAPYERREYLLPPEQIAELIASRATSSEDDDIWADALVSPVRNGDGSQAAEGVPQARELLVCTHGERDDCCGRFGESAFRYLNDRYSSEGLKVWRVSHFGGHRFAPTMLDLPAARSWGWLSEEALDRIVTRTGDTADLRRNYRGWCALPSEIQCAERDLLMEQGWEWLDARMSFSLEVLKRDASPAANGDRSVRAPTRLANVEYTLPEGETTSRTALLEPTAGPAAPASCGAEAKPGICYACNWQPQPIGKVSSVKLG